MPAILRQSFNTNAILGTSFEAAAPADIEVPVLSGAITVGAKTSSTIAVTWPTATDNVGVTGYEVSSDNGATYTAAGLVTSHTFTSLTALTSYNLAVRAFDAAGNRSTALTTTTSTYRAGALGSTILLTTGPIDGNPAGILFNDVVSPGDDAKWFSFVITTAVPSGVLDIDPDGTFTFTGSTDVSFEYQLEVDGANFGAPIPVTLYGSQAVPVNVVSQSVTFRSIATQGYVGIPVNATNRSLATPSAALHTYRGVPVNATSQSTATPSVATLTAEAIPVNVRSDSSVTQGRATQTHVATPAGAINRSTTTTPSVSVGGVTATPVNAISVSTTTLSFAGSTVIGVPVNATCTSRATRARAIVLSSLPSADRAIYTGPPTRATFSR